MFLSHLVVVAIAAFTTDAVPVVVNHVVHERRDAPGSDWVKSTRIEAGAVLPMRIGLTQTNLQNGYDHLMEVSHPDSPRYGKYWSSEDVHAAFAPHEETVDAVREWLTAAGIHGSRIVHSDNKGWLAFDATADEAERLLLTEFYEHEHVYSSKMRVGCDQYHVPEHLQPHIDYITPGIKLSPVVKRTVPAKRSIEPRLKGSRKGGLGASSAEKPPAAKSLPADLRDCGSAITPPCIRALYDIPTASKATPGNSLGLYEQGDYISTADLDGYYKAVAPWIPQGTYPIPALIDGANYSAPSDSSLVGGEADLDVEIAYSLIYPQQVTLYQTDDQIYSPLEVADVNTFNTFLDALDGSYCTYSAYGETGNDPSIDPVYPDPAAGGYKGKLQCGVYKPTNVISASYGEAEADLPINYSKRQCNEFLKLALQGHSILIASGDYGVASAPGDSSPNGCLGPTGKVFNPQYPNNCPYVTTVGGTQLYANQTVLDAESVMQTNLGGSAANFSSSGGFSNYYPQPEYQKEAVAKYFATADLKYPYYSEFQVDVNTTKGLYNRIGRGYPDVAANGAFMTAFINGQLETSDWFGTSLASPTFASVLTLINEERFAIKKGPVGFVNPVLYANPWVLHDIKNGTNLGCDSDGFQAIAGWDPVTGLGTPNYPKMLELFLSLP